MRDEGGARRARGERAGGRGHLDVNDLVAYERLQEDAHQPDLRSKGVGERAGAAAQTLCVRPAPLAAQPSAEPDPAGRGCARAPAGSACIYP